jgi:hypothetical protein
MEATVIYAAEGVKADILTVSEFLTEGRGCNVIMI